MSELGPIDIPLDYTSLGGRSELELVLSGDSRTFVVDLRAWPPRVTEHALPEGILAASRSPRGRWTILAAFDVPVQHRLRVYEHAGDVLPAVDIESPLPPPDLRELLPTLNDDDRRREVADPTTLEAALFLGERLLLVPRHVGFADRRFPWVERDGAWVEERGVPPFEKSLADWRERCGAAAVRLGDGADVLVWGGVCVEVTARGYERTFEHRIDLPWYYDCPLVPAGSDGFFYVDSDRTLQEIHRGGAPPRAHLPCLSLCDINPGPDGSLVLLDRPKVWLYHPEEGWIVEVPEHLLPDPDNDYLKLAVWSPAGFLVLGHQREQFRLSPIAREVLDALPREPVVEFERRRAPATARSAADALEGSFSASRPRLAVDGLTKNFAIAVGAEIHVHCVDQPEWGEVLDSEVVAVVAGGRELAALDAEGRLSRFNAGTGNQLGVLQLDPNPRSLAIASTGEIAALSRSSLQLVRGEVARRLAFDAPLAASFDGAGARLLVVGQHRGAALVTTATGALVPLPEPPEEVHAVAWEQGDVWLALAERSILRFDASRGEWEVAERGSPGDLLARSPDGASWAIANLGSGARIVRAGTLEAVSSVSYPGTYSNRSRERIAVVGLSFLDEAQLVVGLTRGNANILAVDGSRALKLDTFPGSEYDRWLFVFGGHILVAG